MLITGNKCPVLGYYMDGAQDFCRMVKQIKGNPNSMHIPLVSGQTLSYMQTWSDNK